jgi:hypothetical protein
MRSRTFALFIVFSVQHNFLVVLKYTADGFAGYLDWMPFQGSDLLFLIFKMNRSRAHRYLKIFLYDRIGSIIIQRYLSLKTLKFSSPWE